VALGRGTSPTPMRPCLRRTVVATLARPPVVNNSHPSSLSYIVEWHTGLVAPDVSSPNAVHCSDVKSDRGTCAPCPCTTEAVANTLGEHLRTLNWKVLHLHWASTSKSPRKLLVPPSTRVHATRKRILVSNRHWKRCSVHSILTTVRPQDIAEWIPTAVFWKDDIYDMPHSPLVVGDLCYHYLPSNERNILCIYPLG